MSDNTQKEQPVVLLVPQADMPDLKRVTRPSEPEDFEPTTKADPDFPQNLPELSLQYTLPDNYLPETKQAKILEWDLKTTRVVNRQTGLFMQMPMVCRGTDGCEFGKICPVKNRDQFVGQSCPLEVQELFKHFSGYVKDLDIDPDKYTDIQLIARLCREHLILWRTDMAMRQQSEVVSEVGVVDQKSSKAYYKKMMNQNRLVQEKCHFRIQQILTSLMATKYDQRNKKDASQGPTDLSSLLSNVLKEKSESE